MVENLTEVASLEDGELEAYSAILDPTTNILKIKPGKTLNGVPQNPEELRLRRRRVGLAWDFLGTKRSTRSWLSKGGGGGLGARVVCVYTTQGGQGG